MRTTLKGSALLISLTISMGIFAVNHDHHGHHRDQGHHHNHEQSHVAPFSPEEEAAFFSPNRKIKTSASFKSNFPKTTWNECKDPSVTGNYYNYRCAKNRMISEILKAYLKSHLTNCIRISAAAIGDTKIKKIHIEHKGIFADSRHNEKSLHGQGRAIDIKSITYRKSWNRKVKHTHENDGYGLFYTTLRSCWGKALEKNNECPLFEENAGLTGSIGKEDEDHQIHLHLSVPVCFNGQYSETYFRR